MELANREDKLSCLIGNLAFIIFECGCNRLLRAASNPDRIAFPAEKN